MIRRCWKFQNQRLITFRIENDFSRIESRGPSAGVSRHYGNATKARLRASLQHGEKSRRQSDIFIEKRCFIEGDATRPSKKIDGSRHRHSSLACAHYRGSRKMRSTQETTRLDSGPMPTLESVSKRTQHRPLDEPGVPWMMRLERVMGTVTCTQLIDL